MMCNEIYEEQIQYLYVVIVKYEYCNFKLKKFMILSDNRKWIILYGS